MKNLIFLLLFPFFNVAQNSYIEVNAGVAELGDDWIGYGPGLSVLFGKRFEKAESIFLLDMEIGAAIPTLVTGKIGCGFFMNKDKKSAIVAGIRPWPLHFYTQINFNEGSRGQWIMSLEAGSAIFATGSMGQNRILTDLSFASRFNANFGYRWNIRKK